jgi:hypothetical protein
MSDKDLAWIGVIVLVICGHPFIALVLAALILL